MPWPITLVFFRLMIKLNSWQAFEKLSITRCRCSSDVLAVLHRLQTACLYNEHLTDFGFHSQLRQTEQPSVCSCVQVDAISFS